MFSVDHCKRRRRRTFSVLRLVRRRLLLVQLPLLLLPLILIKHDNHGSRVLLGVAAAASTPPYSSYWTYKDPNTRMEWNDLPSHVSLQCTVLSSSSSSSLSLIDPLFLTSAPLVVFGILPPEKDDSDDDDDDDDGNSKRKSPLETLLDDSSSSLQLDVWKVLHQEAVQELVDELLLLDTTNNDNTDDDNDNNKNNNKAITIKAGKTSSVLRARNTSNNSTTVQKIVCLTVRSSTTNTATTTSESLLSHTHNNSKDARLVGKSLAKLLMQQQPFFPKHKIQQTNKNKKNQQHSSSTNDVVVVLPPPPPLSSSYYWTELAAAFWMELYKDRRFKGKQQEQDNNKKTAEASKSSTSNGAVTPLTVHLVVGTRSRSAGEEEDPQQPAAAAVQSALQRGAALARGAYLARDIVQAPHNVLNSVSLAETAARLCLLHRNVLSLRILSADECEKLGMGAFLAVARGSETPPQFLHLTYTPPRILQRRSGGSSSSKRKRKLVDLPCICLIGKGLLFDTGGYNIKRENMEYMKMDCGGAAAVLGAMRSLALLASTAATKDHDDEDEEEQGPPQIVVHCIIAACENMINERAMVPGDVVVASNGKSIEIANTDAEGRLTLADALVYACNQEQVEEIIELSTLTGACVVALGASIAGLFTKSDDLAERLQAASAATGEKLWRMPLNEEDYGEAILSKIADLKNMGAARQGGAIAAALFLHHFVVDTIKFAHIDMAGPVWNGKASQATGWGARLLTEYVCSRAASSLSSYYAESISP